MENNQKSTQEVSILELEHAIGLSGLQLNSVYLHPNNRDFVYISGACIVICDLNDPHKQFFLREHSNQISCLAVSNTGSLLASGENGDNADVVLWNFNQKVALFKLSEHDFQVAHVQFSNDDRLLFSCGGPADKKIFIWDTSNGFIVGSTQIIPDPISIIKWGGFVKDIKGRDSNLYQFATSGNKQIWIWKFDAKLGTFDKEYLNLGSTTRDFLCLDFSKNKEDFLYAGTSSGDFLAIQMKNKILSSVTPVSALGVTSIRAVSPFQLIIGCGDGTLASFSIEANIFKLQRKVTLNGQINSLTNGYDSTQTIASTNQGFAYRLKNEDFQMIIQCENHTSQINFLQYPPQVSDKYASCSTDGTIRLWNVENHETFSRISMQSAGYPISCSYNEEIIISGWQDGKIRNHQCNNQKLIWTIDNAHSEGVTTIVLSQNLKFLCSSGMQGGVRLWEMKSREMISHLKEHTSKVTKIQLLKQDTQLVSSSRDRALLLWDLKTEKRVSAHYSRMGGINSFAILQNSDTVVTTGQDRKFTFWDLRQQNPIHQFNTSDENSKKADECFAIDISHNGKIFAAGGSNEIVKVFDIRNYKILAEESGHSGCINTIAFSYDDKQLITGGNDANIFLWNVFI